MSFPSRLTNFVAEHDLLASGDDVVVGVSGGVDSIVLLHLLSETGFQPIAVHVNYGLRGEASDADEAFVRATCDAWGVPLHVRRVRLGDGSVQAAARGARYALFGEIAHEVGAQTVATAHHRDDQAETLLLNLLRGAGPTGLAGMPVQRALTPGSDVAVVRPLLWATRHEIEAYASAQGLRWREDASNRSGDYRRNVLRREVLPLLERHFGDGATERIAHAAELMRDYLESGAALSAETALDEATVRVPGGWGLRLDTLTARSEPARRGLLIEALRLWAPDAPRSAASVAELDALVTAQPGRHVVWPGVTIWRDRDALIFAPNPESIEWTAEVREGETATPFGTLRIEPLEGVPTAFDPSPYVEVVDADRLGFPLTLRPWRPGDALRPIGLDGHKNVSDVLTERRVPPHLRARQLVLASDGEVVWVVGHRLGAAFALRPETDRVLRLTWTPADSLALDPAGH